MLFGLDNCTINKINGVFSSFGKIEKALIYGSRVKGCYKPSSDIDVALLGMDLTNSDIPEINWALDDLLLPYKIDLTVFEQINNPDLKDHIIRRGVVLYQKK